MSTPISFRQIWPILLAPLVLAACSDAFAPAPAPELDVAMRISDQQGAVPFANPGSTSGLLCDVTFEAQALGRQARATWLDATVLFYAGSNLTVPFDSIIVSANDVRATFSADTIGVGQVEHTRWLFSVTGALDIAMNFHYRVDPGGDIKTATTYLSCGGDGPDVATRRLGKMPATVSPLRVRINAS
ncbi:MAG TPA: hypothetical protein VJN70_06035 [Gemmatimonadaceae bacterium]|nr:hypothetical protein [Gemmatimonadaceae bacterium]